MEGSSRFSVLSQRETDREAQGREGGEVGRREGAQR